MDSILPIALSTVDPATDNAVSGVSDADMEKIKTIVVGKVINHIQPLLILIEKCAKEIQQERQGGTTANATSAEDRQLTLQELAKQKLSNVELRVQAKMQKIMAKRL